MTVAQRNQPLCGSPLYGGYATRYMTRSDWPALAAWLRLHAGQNRMMWEHATGAELTDPTTSEVVAPCAPRNPMAELGEAHCGAPFGKPLVTTFFVWSQQDMGEAPSISGNPQYTPPPYVSRQAGSSTTYGFDNHILVPVPAGSAFYSCSVDAAVYVSTAAAASSVKLDLIPHGGGDSAARTFTFASTSTGYVAGTRLTNFDVTPGKLNRVRARLYCESNAAVVAYLQVLAFSQTT